MAQRIVPPPVFGSDKNYERWKQEIAAWEIVCKIDKKERALNVVLSFPEGSEVRDKVFSTIEITNLNTDDGMTRLIDQLDKWYKKDQLTGAYEAWTKFDCFRKDGNNSMEKYIEDFDKRSRALNKYKITIPNSILAFKLLDCAGLEVKDKQIVLTAVTFTEPEKMYDLMKSALRKFFGSQEVLSLCSGSAISSNSDSQAVTIKPEPVYSADEVHVADHGRFRGQFRGRTTRGRYNYRGSDRKNSADSRGNARRCYVCGSLFHFAASCPKNIYITNCDAGESVQENECLLANVKGFSEITELLIDTFNYALLDSACSSTVCGIDWLNSYMEALSHEDLMKVEEERSDKTFRFGDGNVQTSVKRVKIPVNIVGVKTFVKTDVVDCAIPLLLSKESMKKAKVKLNLENDTAVILGKTIKLTCTASGHYRVPLLESQLTPSTDVIMFTIAGDEKEKKKKIQKLHHQFGHPSCKRLTQLFTDAGVSDEMCFVYAEEVSNNCEICFKYKKTPSRPVVAMNMARNFNDVVAIDLKVCAQGKLYFLHLIDMATRFSRSCIVRSKEPQVIVEKIIEIWIGTGIGPPRKFLCDNGREFANNLFLDLCENMNVQVIHTAAYSPFSNGLCERNHAVIDEMVLKIKAEQPECSLEVALAWAINAKNCLQMVGGYSPYQLVFGRNPNLPCTLNDNLPALEGSTSSEMIAKHLNASHNARKSFIEAETSEKNTESTATSNKIHWKEF